jgi:MoxR-like ATPase
MAAPVSYRHPYPKLVAAHMVGRDGKPFLTDDDLLAAANAALALGRPLLLTGEPGCGKTDFAFAAASGLTDEPQWIGPESRELLEQYVRSETRARDLLYYYDALQRFSDAQTGGVAGQQRAALAQNYVRLEPLGRGLMSPVRRVILIDEIDKAPRDLPNDLLRELDQGWFEIPEIPPEQPIDPSAIDPGQTHVRRRMQPPPNAPKPLVIITSNVERQLPDAFLRRCVFFYIPFPGEQRLHDILDAHFPETSTPLKRSAVALLSELRDGVRLTKRPATAELLDWMAVLTTVFESADVERRLLTAATQAQRGAGVDWRSIPALGCMLKLREDLDRIVSLA